jgi:diguanylate cyclase (GGDEF)-like protein
MTSVIMLAFGHSPSLAAAPYGWAMATAIGSLSRTAGVLWIPILGAVTLLAPIGIAALLEPSVDAKLCGAFALINMYAAIECAKYLHSSFVGRLIAERNASHQASHDPLTGLHNRRVLDARLRDACANSGPVALLALDLDGFKPINDTLGHAAGDEVLCQVARRLQAIVGDNGLAVRAGGDEFFVLVYEPTQASVMAAAILKAISEPYKLREHDARIGVSIGLAQGANVDATQLIREADEALYCAKRRGRGRYEMSRAA